MIYFGTIEGALAQMQYIDCMLSPMSTTHNKYVGNLLFENGGNHVVKSADSHKNYELSFQGHIGKSGSVDTVMDYYHGEYGQGLIYFTDPALIGAGKNVLRRNWATPGIIPTGYKNIYDNDYTVTSGNLPVLTWEIVGNNSRQFRIAVPANHTLWLGARYSATGTAEIAVYKDGVYLQGVTPSAIDGNGLLTDSFAGEGVFHIEFAGDEGDFISVQSIDAQILPNGQTGQATGGHVRGQGVSGLRFSTQSVPYEYVSAFNELRSFSVALEEVEEWL